MTVINIDSEAWCRKAYLNYHCYNNSMKISEDEMNEIISAWSSKLSSWQASVSSDENEYVFDDSEYSTFKENGKTEAENATGYERTTANEAKQYGRVTADGVATVANAVALSVGTKVAEKVGEKVIEKVGGKVIEKSMGKCVSKLAADAGAKTIAKGAAAEEVKKATEEAAAEGAKQTAKAAGVMISCTFSAITGAAYWAQRPNKDEVEASRELQGVMTNNQSELEEASDEMGEMNENLKIFSDEAEEMYVNANDNINKQKEDYDSYKITYDELKVRVANNESLSDSDKARYKMAAKGMAATGENITSTQEDTTETVGEIYDDMGTFQTGYDNAAETMGNVEGTTDYAESFDSATKTLCYVDAAFQGLNAAEGGIAAVKAFSLSSLPFMQFMAGFGAAGAAGAAASAAGAAEQLSWAAEVGTEMDMRVATQSLNTDTMSTYDDDIDAYDGFMQGVEDLEFDIPDDVSAPADTSSADAQTTAATATPTAAATPTTETTTTPDPADKKDKNEEV